MRRRKVTQKRVAKKKNPKRKTPARSRIIRESDPRRRFIVTKGKRGQKTVYEYESYYAKGNSWNPRSGIERRALSAWALKELAKRGEVAGQSKKVHARKRNGIKNRKAA